MLDDNIITVSQLNNYIRKIIDAEELLYAISVVGEVSSFSLSMGTAYFTIKESDCLLNCVMFGCTQNYKLGDKIVVKGTPKYYAKGGKLNFNVTKIELYGQGELYKQFLELKDKLSKEGLFDLDKKVPLPQTINTIGIVTSKTGAVIQDIFNVSTRRNPFIKLKLYSCQVQGKDCEQSVCEGIKYFDNSNVDVILIARGGGSSEDLSPFNSEKMARTIFACTKPTVSAIGHETDFSIIDFVASVRAPTPSAAAELLTNDVNVVSKDMLKSFQIISKNIIKLLSQNDNKINLIFHMISTNITHKIGNIEQNLKLLSNNISKLNPIQILKRGYTQIFKNNEKIKSATQLKHNDKVTISFVDGTKNAKIIEEDE